MAAFPRPQGDAGVGGAGASGFADIPMVDPWARDDLSYCSGEEAAPANVVHSPVACVDISDEEFETEDALGGCTFDVQYSYGCNKHTAWRQLLTDAGQKIGQLEEAIAIQAPDLHRRPVYRHVR